MSEFKFVDDDFKDFEGDLHDYACNRCEYEFQHPDDDIQSCPKCCINDVVML